MEGIGIAGAEKIGAAPILPPKLVIVRQVDNESLKGDKSGWASKLIQNKT